MVGENDVSARVYFQIFKTYAVFFKLSHFFENDGRSDNRSVSHYANGIRVKNAAGNKTQFVRDSVRNYGVTRVASALSAYDHIRLRSEYIDGFAFSFVAPLSAY